MHSSTLEWDDTLPFATYCFNMAPLINDLESPFDLVHDTDLLEGRLSHLQKYCRYVGEQPGRLAVRDLRNMWKMHVKLHKVSRQTEPETDSEYNSTKNLKEGQLVNEKPWCKGFPTLIFSGLPNHYNCKLKHSNSSDIQWQGMKM